MKRGIGIIFTIFIFLILSVSIGNTQSALFAEAPAATKFYCSTSGANTCYFDIALEVDENNNPTDTSVAVQAAIASFLQNSEAITPAADTLLVDVVIDSEKRTTFTANDLKAYAMVGNLLAEELQKNITFTRNTLDLSAYDYDAQEQGILASNTFVTNQLFTGYDTVILPNGIKTIASQAFQGTFASSNLSLVFPESLNTIAQDAFTNVPKLDFSASAIDFTNPTNKAFYDMFESNANVAVNGQKPLLKVNNIPATKTATSLLDLTFDQPTFRYADGTAFNASSAPAWMDTVYANGYKNEVKLQYYNSENTKIDVTNISTNGTYYAVYEYDGIPVSDRCVITLQLANQESKVTPTITLTVTPSGIITVDDEVTITATVTSTSSADLDADAKVSFIINNGVVTTKDVVDGSCELKIKLPAGNNQLLLSYSGNANYNTVLSSIKHLAVNDTADDNAITIGNLSGAIIDTTTWMHGDQEIKTTITSNKPLKSIVLQTEDGEIKDETSNTYKKSSMILFQDIENVTTKNMSFKIHKNGSYTLYVTDYEDHQESISFNIDKLDTVLPTLTVQEKDLSVTLQATDQDSGIKTDSLKYATAAMDADESSLQYTNTYTAPFDLDEDFNGKVCAKVEDLAGNETKQCVNVVSAQVQLKTLRISKGILTPSFDPLVTSYHSEVDADVESINIEATANDVLAQVSGDIGNVQLKVGENTLVVKVKNGSKENNYTINVKRKSSTEPPQNDDMKITNNDGSITVIGTFDESYKVMSEALQSPNVSSKTEAQYDILDAYDIYITKDDKRYELKKEVEVQIKRKTNWNTEVKIVYIDDDGDAIPMKTEVHDDYISFKTNHFSTYAVVNRKSVTPPASSNDDVDGGTGNGSVQTGQDDHMMMLSLMICCSFGFSAVMLNLQRQKNKRDDVS